MVREDILGGLRTAMARGQSLREAMMTFYNAGYIKQEIEEAAKVLVEEKNNPTKPKYLPVSPTPLFQRGVSNVEGSKNEPKEVFSQIATKKSIQPIQKVSAYGSNIQKSQQMQNLQTVQPTQIKSQQVQSQQVQANPVQQPIKTQTTQKVSAYGTQTKSIQKSKPVQAQQPIKTQTIQSQVKPIQKVSAYGSSSNIQKPRGKAIIFILLALLILLIGALIALFFFKDEVLSFFQ